MSDYITLDLTLDEATDMILEWVGETKFASRFWM